MRYKNAGVEVGTSEAGSLKSTKDIPASLAYHANASPRRRWTKAMRLRHRRQFRRVWNEGSSWVHPLFILRIAPNGEETTRIGLIASRKIGNAVMRNRARRLLREAVRQIYPQLPGGLDVILIARRPLREAKCGQVEAALRVMFRRAGVMNVTDR